MNKFEVVFYESTNGKKPVYEFLLNRTQDDFIKKTQKIPVSEIDLAKKRRIDYINRSLL